MIDYWASLQFNMNQQRCKEMERHRTSGLFRSHAAIAALRLVLFAVTLWISANASAQGVEQRGNAASRLSVSPAFKAAADQLTKVFPSLYWYASDTCLRETTRHGLGHFQKHDEFVKSTKAVLENIKEEGRAGKQDAIVLRLYDPESPEEYWALELTRENNVWKPKTGYKYMNGKRAFDLFQDEFLAGTKIMGSMKPYLERALVAYSQGKDFRIVFARSSALPAQEMSTKAKADQLVGSWRHADPARKRATNISFRRDGTYVGSIEEDGKLTCSFSGKWELKDGILNYEYTAALGIPIPVGTKDQDQVIAISKDRYAIQNALGLRETYTRIK